MRKCILDMKTTKHNRGEKKLPSVTNKTQYEEFCNILRLIFHVQTHNTFQIRHMDKTEGVMHFDINWC